MKPTLPQPSNKPIGLRDLARLAHVDVSTVSRSLNQDPRIDRNRAAQIRQLAHDLGYRPRPLRSKHTKTIGLLIGSNADGPASHFIGRIFWLIEHLLSERGLHVNVAFYSLEESNALIPKMVEENRVDGLILAGNPPVSLVKAIKAFDIPMVAINDSIQRLNIDCVRSDPSDAIREIVLRLCAWGHRHFTLILHNEEIPTNQTRREAYHEALNFSGIKPDRFSILVCDQSEVAGGREAVQKLMNFKTRPTALLCENDWMALGALHELGKNKITAPRQISVVGHDDVPTCREFSPTLTTIQRSEQDMVSQAIDLLLKQIQTGTSEPREILISGKVIWRESTGKIPNKHEV